MDMRLSAVIRREDALYVAWCPELDIASQGETREDALANLKEAAELYLEDPDARLPDEQTLITTFEVNDDPAAGAVGA